MLDLGRPVSCQLVEDVIRSHGHATQSAYVCQEFISTVENSVVHSSWGCTPKVKIPSYRFLVEQHR